MIEVTYNKNPKKFRPVEQIVAHHVAVDMGVDVPLTRYGRRKARIVLVGVKYADPRYGRNNWVSVDGGPPVKFKRTGEYREGRK